MNHNWTYCNPLRIPVHSPRLNEAEIRSERKQAAKARRIAKKVGLTVCKSRQRTIHANNLGRLQLVDPYTNTIVAGENFDLSAEDVIAYCEEIIGSEK